MGAGKGKGEAQMPAKKKKSSNLHAVVNYAKGHRLFALREGESERDHKWSFWSKVTGKLVLTYYPHSGRWMTGDGRCDGVAKDFKDALLTSGAAKRRRHDKRDQ